MTKRSNRPDMRAYFKWRIDVHVNGLMSGSGHNTLPHGVRVSGDVTDRLITVTDRDGVRWQWKGGEYAARKVNGCYAPLMPKPIEATPLPKAGDTIRTTALLPYGDSKPGEPDPSSPPVGTTATVVQLFPTSFGYQIVVKWDHDARLRLMLNDTDPFEVVP